MDMCILYLLSEDARAFAGGVIHILREASVLSILLCWAIPGPLIGEWAMSMALTLFCLYKLFASARVLMHFMSI